LSAKLNVPDEGAEGVVITQGGRFAGWGLVMLDGKPVWAYKNTEQPGDGMDDTIVALGGGVIGDLAGYAAATFQRGVRLVQAPTTLLAMVDAAVGGKVAVDMREGKNYLGTFYQPRLVVEDLDTLATLPDREVRCGWAEVAKHGLLAGGETLALTEAGVLDGAHPGAGLLAADVRFKAAVVGRDPRHGDRAFGQSGDAVAADVVGRDHRLALPHQHAQSDIVAFRALGFLDAPIADLDALRNAAHRHCVGGVRARAPRRLHQPLRQRAQGGLIEQAGVRGDG
jgi:hypothetical protein